MNKTPIYIEADVAVIGGGLAGMCAAIAAARGTAKVVLVQNRPVLGGNQSSEMKVGISGADCSGYALTQYTRETGILDEIMMEHLHDTPDYYNGYYKQDVLFWKKVTAEKNIRLLLNTSATGVELGEDGSILTVLADQHSTEKSYKISAKIFIDASGDSRIASEAGADFRVGREASSEFGESKAPKEADSGTMGSSIYFHAREMDRPVPFTPPEWAYDFKNDEELPYRPMVNEVWGTRKQFSGFWWLEYGGTLDTISDDEEIRDELYKIIYGIWDHMKNHGDHGCENYDIVWMNTMPSKRESRRLLGDHILCEADVLEHPLFDDRVAYGGWSIDIHPPKGIFSKEPPSSHTMLEDVWSIPLRSLYSRNVPNLFMAGRNLSATHVALGSARVMATCALMGQAVGTAAQMCIRYKASPREIGKYYITELQQQLLKDDCYIIDLKNEDPSDLARSALISASSEEPLRLPDKGFARIPLSDYPAQLIPVSGGRLDWVELDFEAEVQGFAILQVYRSPRINKFPESEALICETEATVPAGLTRIRFDLGINGEGDALYWFAIKGDTHVLLVCSEEDQPIGTRLTSVSDNVRRPHNGTAVLNIEPVSYPYSKNNVCSGVARPEKWTNIWISDSTCPLPQKLELAFSAPTLCNSVQLTFDTDMNKNIYLPKPWGTVGEGDRAVCVKDYDIWGITSDGEKILLVSCRDNYQRHRVHRFDTVQVEKLTVQILATHGDPSARIYEIRCYNEPKAK